MFGAKNEKLYKMVGTALFAAVVVLFQLTLGLITVGTVNLNFVLVPIALSGILFGAFSGAITGFAFGLTVFFQCITGAQGPFGSALFSINPYYTFIACAARGLIVGLLAALICQALTKTVKNRFACALITSIAAPILNTGIFLACYALFFNSHMHEIMTAEGAGVLYVLFILLAGLNFVFELVTSILLIPPISVVLEKAKGART